MDRFVPIEAEVLYRQSVQQLLAAADFLKQGHNFVADLGVLARDGIQVRLSFPVDLESVDDTSGGI